jgi:hypothetical protein
MYSQLPLNAYFVIIPAGKLITFFYIINTNINDMTNKIRAVQCHFRGEKI